MLNFNSASFLSVFFFSKESKDLYLMMRIID